MSRADEPEDLLAAQRKPFQDLYILSLPGELRDLVLGPDREVPSMATVAEEMEAAPFKSVYKLHAVASALNRKPDLVDQVDDLVVALGKRGSQQLREGLQLFADGLPPWDPSDPSTVPKLTPARWRDFLRALRLEDEDLGTDMETVE